MTLITWRHFCFSCVLALLGVQALGDDITRPNVIYIMADELGYFEPGFMGGKNILTPNLDQMAKEGMVFDSL